MPRASREMGRFRRALTRTRASRRFGYGSTTADVRGARGVNPACPLEQPFNASRLVPYSPSHCLAASIAPGRDQRREYDLANRVVKTKTRAKPPSGSNRPPQKPTCRYRPHHFHNVAPNCARTARSSHISSVARPFDGYKNPWALVRVVGHLSAGSGSHRFGTAGHHLWKHHVIWDAVTDGHSRGI